MAHYNFKKITVVPSAKVRVLGPSAVALFLRPVAGKGGPRPAMVPRGPGCQGHVLESRAPRVSVPSERVGFSPQTLDSSRDEAVLS